MPRAPKARQKKNTENLEQNKEFHASTSQNSHVFAWDSIFFFILSERSLENLSQFWQDLRKFR